MNKDYVDAVSSGMNWIEAISGSDIVYDIEIIHNGGLDYDCIAKTKDGDIPISFPFSQDKPDQKISDWIHGLSNAEILTGAKIYYDIWTWHDSSSYYRERMDAFSKVAKTRATENSGNLLAGTARYNVTGNYAEVFDGAQWIQISGSGPNS